MCVPCRGHNIGVRLVDEFLAKTGVTQCSNFRETADTIAKVAFKMFLGMNCEVAHWNTDSTAFSIMLPTGSATPSSSAGSSSGGGGGSGGGLSGHNPITEFVELPPQFAELQYSNLLCGVVRGALEMLQLGVEVRFVRDVLRGDDSNEMRVELKGALETSMAEEYREN